MLTSGDVVDLDLEVQAGREAGFRHPVIVVTAQRILEASPNVIQVVPLTTTIRHFSTEPVMDPDERNGLVEVSAAQCQHIRALSTARIENVRGNAGQVVLDQIRELIALILDLP